MLGKPLGKQSVSRAVLLFCFLPQPAKQLNCFYFLASQTSIIKKKQTPKTIPQASSSRGTRHSTLPDSQGNSFNPLPLLQTWLFIPCRFRRKKIYIYIIKINVYLLSTATARNDYIVLYNKCKKSQGNL